MAVKRAASTLRTTCCYCGVGCGVLIHTSTNGVLSLEGDPEHPVNRGKLCSKGRYLLHTALDRSDRLLVPELREKRDELRQPVSWERAIDYAATVIRKTVDQYGPDAVAFYVSGQCLTEEYYLANKIAKGFIGTNNIDTNSRLCMSTAVSAYRMALGEDSVPCSYNDLDLADLFFIAGANPAWCHPILFQRIEDRLSRPGARIIVVDPRRTQTAAMADLHLALWPGTDITLFHAIARWLIEHDAVDHAFVTAHTEGFESLRERVMERSLSESAHRCRIPETDITTAARWIAESNGFLSLWAMGLNQSTIGVNKCLALINLHLLTGKIGKPGHGPFSLTGQPNAMGGREVGGMSTMLSAHRDLTKLEHRQEIAHYWGVKQVPDQPGFTAGEMADALLAGRLKVLWIICTNPLVSWPDLTKAEKALAAAEFVIVQEISNRSDSLRFADLVLPAATWMEKEGTMTNSERRISHLSKVVEGPTGTLSDSEILLRFAEAMGWGHSFINRAPADLYLEHVGLTKGTNLDISGLDYARLKDQGSIKWPVPHSGHPGTERLFTDGQFYRPGGRAKIHDVVDENTSPAPDVDYPLVLTTGRIRDQWHTMTRTGKVKRLGKHEPEARLDIHPMDARERDLCDGQLVEVRSRTGQAVLRARVSESVRKGLVFFPMHWGRQVNRPEVRANNLTDSRCDPQSKEPDFKWSTVQVKPWRTPRKRILIVGAGPAALAFIRTYRQDNPNDVIEVFSKESVPFYNRVCLPEVIAMPRAWQGLSLLEPDECRQLNLMVHPSMEIQDIDCLNQRVCDDGGHWHAYDVLVLAMGSRAAWPRDAPQTLEGVHTLRNYDDAQKIISSTENGRTIVIVGGGLIGLEVAGALSRKGIPIQVVQRSAQLMTKQLDTMAAEMVYEDMTDRGVEFHFQDEVVMWRGDQRIEEIYLNSGHRIREVSLIYAMGTLPNIELAVRAGLLVNRGVVVDAAMRTSDPAILAIGEVAEFSGKVHGITAACEAQGRAAARFLAGDIQAFYTDSISQTQLKVPGLSLASLGVIKPPADDRMYEEILFLDRRARCYKKCVLRQDRLVGALLLGDQSEFLEFRDLIQSGEELCERRSTLLRSGSKTTPTDGRVVCSCTNIGENTLRAICTGNVLTLAELMNRTGAGTGCGSCRPELRAFLQPSSSQVAS